MTLKKLRPYQEQGINLIARAVGNGARAVLFVLSTGGGKSRVQAELIGRHLAKVPQGRVLVTERTLPKSWQPRARGLCL